MVSMQLNGKPILLHIKKLLLLFDELVNRKKYLQINKRDSADQDRPIQFNELFSSIFFNPTSLGISNSSQDPTKSYKKRLTQTYSHTKWILPNEIEVSAPNQNGNEIQTEKTKPKFQKN